MFDRHFVIMVGDVFINRDVLDLFQKVGAERFTEVVPRVRISRETVLVQEAGSHNRKVLVRAHSGEDPIRKWFRLAVFLKESFDDLRGGILLPKRP